MELTKKDLLEYIKDMNDDATIQIERIEDVYFNKHGWSDNSLKIPTNYLSPGSYNEFVIASQVTKSIEKNTILIHAHL